MSLKSKPAYCYESGCPLAETGTGFVLGSGDPATADFVAVLEAPGKDEPAFRLVPDDRRGFFATKTECDEEIARRRKRYPEIEDHIIRKGVPVVGKAGALLFQWIFQPLGITRPKLFIDNTLRCLPPKYGTANYPTGSDRKLAEKCCRHYDRFDEFKPDTLVFTIHPAAIQREVTPLPLVIADTSKARDFAAQGRRVMLLLGGKAVKAFARFGENITKFRGDYLPLPPNWFVTYKSRFDDAKKARTVGKNKKAYDSLEAMLGGADVADPFEKPKRKRKPRAKKTQKESVA